MNKKLSLVIMLVFGAVLCISGCGKGSKSETTVVGDKDGSKATTQMYDQDLSTPSENIDLSGLESTVSFNGLDLSKTDRILVQLAYCNPDEYSYWIEDVNTISKVSTLVKNIEGEDLFFPQGMFELSLNVTFYNGDSEVFYIGVGEDYFESGTKIEDNIEGASGYMDGYHYSNGTEKEAKELIKLLLKNDWKEGR